MVPGDVITVQTDPSILMRSVWYTTNLKIHGVHHNQTPNQLLFLGYECMECHEVYLVPDSVTGVDSLGNAMRHECTDRIVGSTR